MKSFRERNPLTIGLIGSAVLAAGLTATFNVDNLPIVGGGTSYRAEFSEAAGLKADDEVRIAGIKVGKVTNVDLARDHVEVKFKVSDAWVGDRTSAEIKIRTLLGQKYLALRPAGESDQDPDQEITKDRTVTPFDVTEAFNGLSDTVGAIDTEQLAMSFRAISDSFRNSPPYVRSALNGLSSLSRTISSRDAELKTLLANARAVSGRLADSGSDVDALLNDGNALLTELDNRRDAIRKLLTGARDLGTQLSGLVRDNQAQLAPALRKLSTVTDILQRQDDRIAESLRLAGPYFRVVNNTIGNGRWFDVYICGLTLENRDPCTPPAKTGGAR